GYEASAHNDRYMATVGRFKHTLDPAYLAPFEGDGVDDTAGVWHPFETDPNTLLWLTASDPGPFEQVYRIVVRHSKRRTSWAMSNTKKSAASREPYAGWEPMIHAASAARPTGTAWIFTTSRGKRTTTAA